MTKLASNIPAFLTEEETAKHLKVSRRLVQRLIKKGKLRVVRFGRTVRIHEADLQDFVDAHRT